MNLLGKIFVVLIVVMSLVFMGFAVSVYSTHTNWRVARDKLKKDYDELQAQRSNLELDRKNILETTATEKAALQQQLSKLESEKAELVKERTELKNNEAALKAQVAQAVDAMNAVHETLRDQRQELVGLRQEIVSAHTERDKTFEELVKTTDENHVVKNDLTIAKDRNLLLAEMVNKAKEMAARLGWNLAQDPEQVAPAVPGVVLASSRDMIEVSLGADDGLRPGHTLEVYRPRNGMYLGRVEVVRTEPDKAVAKVIPEFRRGVIEKEDHVKSRLDD